MKKFTFPAYCSFGEGDSGDTYVDVMLTDEEAERLVFYASQPEINAAGFSKCKELKALYKKVYSEAVEQITEELKENGEDWLDEEYLEDDEWKADDTFDCGVDFPEKLA